MRMNMSMAIAEFLHQCENDEVMEHCVYHIERSTVTDFMLA